MHSGGGGYVPSHTSRKIISNNAHRGVTIGFGEFRAAVRGPRRKFARARVLLAVLAALAVSLYTRGSMINRDRTIRATDGGGWCSYIYVRTYGQPCRIKLSKATSGLRPPDRTGQKRRSHPVIAKGLRRAIPSRRAIRLASRRSFYAIFFSPLAVFSFFLSLSLSLLPSPRSPFFPFALRPRRRRV